MNKKLISAFLIDDHSIIREGVRMIIENDREIELAGEAENMKNALAALSKIKPDIILLDLDLGSEFALDFMPEIFAASEKSRILVLTGITDGKIHQRAIQMGASGIVLKTEAGGTLLRAIKKVNKGEVWVDRSMASRMLSESSERHHKNQGDQAEADRIASLTSRERDIVKLIAEGLVNKEIAERLFISEKTIRNCLTVIYSKLQVANRLELAIYAAKKGLDK